MLKHCVSHVHWESMRHDCRFYLKFMTIMIKSMVIDYLYFLLYNCIFLNYCSRQQNKTSINFHCFSVHSNVSCVLIMIWVRQQQCYYFPYLHVVYIDSTYIIHVLLSIWSQIIKSSKSHVWNSWMSNWCYMNCKPKYITKLCSSVSTMYI